ncbi:MAG: winged helix-turn-helix domain-containing protein [Burkholderiaceae bacterium]
MPKTIYRFSRCEVDTQARELRVDGQAQGIEPRPFDVLVLLLRHRDRAVSTDELLDRLWRDEPVAPGSVVNAVAKVRRTIGDQGQPELIRTMHRVGYRFVGDVVEALPPEPQPSAFPSGPPLLSIALLPFENLTGTPSLDWVSLGLLSLVCQALSQSGRVAPLPVSVIVAAPRRAGTAADASEREAAVQRITGARHVAHTRLRRNGDDYVLDCRLRLPGGEVETVLRASHLATLGRVLAHWLMAQLDPDHPTAQMDGPAPDAWALEVLARALEASAERQWELAEALLAVVLDLEPALVTAELELLQVRASQRETEGRFGAALDLWREAAVRARANGQRAVAERANARAALAAAMCGLADEALARAEDYFAQAQASGTRDELWRRVPLLWNVQVMVGQPVAFGPISEPANVDELPRDARAACWSVRAHKLAQKDDHDGAAAAFAIAADLYRGLGAVGRECSVLIPWLESLIQAGRGAEAQAPLQRAEAIGGGNGMLLRCLPWLRARQRDACGDRLGAMSALAPLLGGTGLDFAHAAAVALAARWLAEDGRMGEAQATISRVSPGFLRHPMVRAVAAHIAAGAAR